MADQIALYGAETRWGSELRDVEVLEYRRNAEDDEEGGAYGISGPEYKLDKESRIIDGRGRFRSL